MLAEIAWWFWLVIGLSCWLIVSVIVGMAIGRILYWAGRSHSDLQKKFDSDLDKKKFGC